jgi:ATP-binding cassette subfamily F protein uup
VAPPKPAVKLSYKEQRELAALPDRIAALEKEQMDLRAELADGSLFAKDAAKASQMYARDAAIDDELLAALERMEALGQR